MLSGRRAFGGSTQAAVFDAILNHEPPELSAAHTSIPAGIDRVVRKAMEKNLEDRYASAADFATDLKKCRILSDQSGLPSKGAAASRRRAAVVIGACVVLIVAVWLAWQARNSGKAPAVQPSDTTAQAELASSLVTGLRMAVLPFATVGEDSEQRYLSEGLMGQLVTQLSSHRELAIVPCRAGPCEGDAVDARTIGRELGERAVALDDSSQLAHIGLSLVLAFVEGAEVRAVAEMRRAIDFNPSSHLVMTVLPNYLVLHGDYETGVALSRRAEELIAFPPVWVDFPQFVDDYVHGRFEQALERAMEGVVGDVDFREPLFRAAALGQLGRVEEAQPHLDRLRELWAELCREADCGRLDYEPLRDELLVRQAFSEEVTDRILEGLRKAGFESS